MSQTGQEFEENLYCDADPNSDEIILEQIDDSAHEEFCQNQEDTAFEDPFENSSQNLSENNDLSFENISTSASSSKNRKITKIPSQITGLEVD